MLDEGFGRVGNPSRIFVGEQVLNLEEITEPFVESATDDDPPSSLSNRQIILTSGCSSQRDKVANYEREANLPDLRNTIP